MKHTNRIWLLMGKHLSHAITPAEQQELNGLLQQDPELWYAYEQIQAVNTLDDATNEFIDEIKHLLDHQPDPEKLSEALQRHTVMVREKEPPRRRLAPRRIFMMAAIFAGVAALAWAGTLLLRNGRPVQVSAMNEIVAPKGSKTQITLADGTEIWLNAGSKLTYPKNFSLENREVSLVGEAFFKVVHHDKYAFVVHTPEADVKDLGTTFNVKAYAGDGFTETTLIEGALEVLPTKGKPRKILLAPNEKLVLHHGPAAARPEGEHTEPQKVVPFSATNDIVETAWVENKLIFRNERFSDLAASMERRYNVAIVIEGEDMKAWQLTGIFKNESLEEALKLLQVIAPFKFTITNDKVLITR